MLDQAVEHCERDILKNIYLGLEQNQVINSPKITQKGRISIEQMYNGNALYSYITLQVFDFQRGIKILLVDSNSH